MKELCLNPSFKQNWLSLELNVTVEAGLVMCFCHHFPFFLSKHLNITFWLHLLEEKSYSFQSRLPQACVFKIKLRVDETSFFHSCTKIIKSRRSLTVFSVMTRCAALALPTEPTPLKGERVRASLWARPPLNGTFIPLMPHLHRNPSGSAGL